MAKDQPAMPESLEEMPFPVHGLNLINEFESQPPGTTPIGNNVRSYEPSTQRNRGGARPGLTEYINSTVLGFPSKIQHLNIIVDPTTDALLIDDPTGDTVDDPSTNNLSLRNPPPARKVRRGGSARQPNRNKKKAKPKIVFVQSNFTFNDGSPGIITLPTAVKVGDLLVFMASLQANTTIDNDPGPIAFFDNLGTSYNQVNGYVSYGGPFPYTLMGVAQPDWNNGINISMFYGVVSTAGALSLTYSFGGGAVSVNTFLLNFRNTATLSPLDGSSTRLVTTTSLDLFTKPYASSSIPITGTIFGGAPDLVVAFFLDCSGSIDFNAGFHDACPLSPVGLVLYNTGVALDVVVSGTAFSPYNGIGPPNTDGSGNPLPTQSAYFSIGASFKAKP